MMAGFEKISPISEAKLVERQSQWLQLVNLFLEKIKKARRTDRLIAHFDASDERIVIYFKGQSAHIKRRGEWVWFENGARASMESIEGEIEHLRVSKKFVGWPGDEDLREDIEYVLSSFLEKFQKDSEIVWNASYALQDALDNPPD